MVKAIDFVVRDSAGGLVRGNVAGDGSNFVQMGMGEEISLNLARESIVGFAQDGGDLVITLVDGRQIVLADYFNQAGEANQLYLSQNGDVVAVELTSSGDGNLFARQGRGPIYRRAGDREVADAQRHGHRESAADQSGGGRVRSVGQDRSHLCRRERPRFQGADPRPDQHRRH